MGSQIDPEQDVRLDTARRLVEQAQQLLLGCPVRNIPEAYLNATTVQARELVNAIRRCQAPRMWALAPGQKHGDPFTSEQREVALHGHPRTEVIDLTQRDAV